MEGVKKLVVQNIFLGKKFLKIKNIKKLFCEKMKKNVETMTD